MNETLAFAHYARRARNVLRFLRKSAPIDIFESISTDDHRALARASDIVEGKLSYPRQNGLAVALRELGRIERTLFILDWLQSAPMATPNCSTVGQSNCSRQDGVIMRGLR